MESYISGEYGFETLSDVISFLFDDIGPLPELKISRDTLLKKIQTCFEPQDTGNSYQYNLFGKMYKYKLSRDTPVELPHDIEESWLSSYCIDDDHQLDVNIDKSNYIKLTGILDKMSCIEYKDVRISFLIDTSFSDINCANMTHIRLSILNIEDISE